jgi:hypothetical protein
VSALAKQLRETEARGARVAELEEQAADFASQLRSARSRARARARARRPAGSLTSPRLDAPRGEINIS